MVKKEVSKNQIRNIFFLGILPKDLQRKTYDASFEGDGSVQLWLERNDTYSDVYDLYIGGDSRGVYASPWSSYLFYNFPSLETIDLRNFNTSGSTTMSPEHVNCSIKKYAIAGFNFPW